MQLAMLCSAGTARNNIAVEYCWVWGGVGASQASTSGLITILDQVLDYVFPTLPHLSL